MNTLPDSEWRGGVADAAYPADARSSPGESEVQSFRGEPRVQIQVREGRSGRSSLLGLDACGKEDRAQGVEKGLGSLVVL